MCFVSLNHTNIQSLFFEIQCCFCGTHSQSPAQDSISHHSSTRPLLSRTQRPSVHHKSTTQYTALHTRPTHNTTRRKPDVDSAPIPRLKTACLPPASPSLALSPSHVLENTLQGGTSGRALTFKRNALKEGDGGILLLPTCPASHYTFEVKGCATGPVRHAVTHH